jgi:hypothetical protein
MGYHHRNLRMAHPLGLHHPRRNLRCESTQPVRATQWWYCERCSNVVPEQFERCPRCECFRQFPHPEFDFRGRQGPRIQVLLVAAALVAWGVVLAVIHFASL